MGFRSVRILLSRRALRAFAVAATGLLLGALAVAPEAAYAASSTTTTPGGQFNGTFSALLPSGYRIGNCTMHDSGQTPSRVALDGTTGTLTWSGLVTSNHGGDVWWVTFAFKNAGGSTVYTSPKMRTQDIAAGQFWDFWLVLYQGVGPDTVSQIAQVTWSMSC